jgi:predicted MPP superfamily phosphohydrolase
VLRVVIIVAIVAVVFGAANVGAFRALTRLHPRRRRIVMALVIVGNLMWLFFPMLNARTPFSRLARAVLGPPWFAWQCFAILYSVLVLLIAIVWLLWRPLRLRSEQAARPPLHEFARWPSRAFLWVTLVAAVVGGWQALVPLRVERVPVALRDLPPSLDGTRIALVADLHVGLFTRPSRLRQIFAATNALRPDIVLLAGDLVDDDPIYLPKLIDGLRPLETSLPLFAVLGNHEMYGAPEELMARMRATRVRLLVNEGAAVRGLWIAGLSDYAARVPSLRPDMAAALRAQPAGAFPIVVSHQPKSFDEARRRGIALTLCAHTHGGQCGFRPLGWSLAGLFLPYHMGLYQVGGAQLYVNTGTGYWLLPWRLGMTPEITLIELRRARSTPPE